ncbi:putative xyloglucan endotransglucosylase/hydrolase protein 27 [Hordeum vulgare]|nr:putative xyloglucan endotransglucosylase/hydrolase protein 27 [Hordeum vulgare]
MACHFLLAVLLASSSWVAASSAAAADDVMVPRPTTAAALTFREGYTQLFGDSNLRLHGDGKRVHISLDERTGTHHAVLHRSILTFLSPPSVPHGAAPASVGLVYPGSGFASQGAYFHGFFSASIKLPSDYAAGVVVAFYMSNGDVYEKTHDELDFEFLGNVRGKEWRVQTNVYGDGSTAVGREERYGLWFDPTHDFHRYAILWTNRTIVFYVDGTPIREVVRSEAMGAQFPSKPMSLYATIWDGSSWATSGGRYKVEYKYAPYVAEFTDLELRGCASMIEPSRRRASRRGCRPGSGRRWRGSGRGT